MPDAHAARRERVISRCLGQAVKSTKLVVTFDGVFSQTIEPHWVSYKATGGERVS